METWKESQLKRLTFAKGLETAYPILLQFAENSDSTFVRFQLFHFTAT